MHPGSNHSSLSGWFLLADHVRLELGEVPAQVEGKLHSLVTVALRSSTQRFSATIRRLELLSRYTKRFKASLKPDYLLSLLTLW